MRPYTFIVGIAACLIASPTLAATYRMDASVLRDDAAGSASFDIAFGFQPDFYSVDSVGRQKDSFQVFIDPDNGPSPINSTRILIRGEELHYGGDLRLRDVEPPVDDPEANGWGPLRGTVPFTVSEDRILFSVPYQLLDAPSGIFSWQVIKVRYGDLTGVKVGSTATPIPAPPAILLAMSGIITLLGFTFHRRRRNSSVFSMRLAAPA